jgi:putative ABC transport system permease protein
MNLWLYSVRDMVRRPGRSLLTLLSIVLGVATVFAVSSTIGGARVAYGRMTEALSGKADAQVAARGGGRFLQELTLPLEQSPQVQVAVPLLHQQALLYAGQKRIQINGVGTVLAKEKMLRPFELASGRLPTLPAPTSEDGEEGGWEMVLEESLAQSAGVKTGDEIKLLTPRKLQRVRVVGLIRPTELWAFTQGGLVYLNLEDWQWMCKAEGKIDALQVGLVTSIASGADKKRVLDSLARELPQSLQLRSTQEDQSSGSVTFVAFQYGLEAARTLALVVAGLLILNTFLMNVAERRGQIGVLRLIGGTRAQIMRLLLREGAVIGIVGALLGLPLGWLLALWLARGMENAFGVRLQPPELSLGPTLFAFAMGSVVAMVAAYWPARRASRIGPLDNLRQRATGQPERIGWRKTAFGAVLLVLSITGMFLSWARIISQEVALTVAIFFLIGLLFVFPTVLRPGYALVYRLLRFLGPMEFELAFRQLVRTQSRALLTWGILFMAVSTSVATGLILTDVINDIRGEVRRTTLDADFIIRVTQINLATGTSPNLPEDLHAEVRRLSGVQSVEAMRIFGLEVPKAGRAVVVVREFSMYERPPLELLEMDLHDARRKILEGDIVLSDILAYKLRKKAGDFVTFDYAGKQFTFRVAGTSRFYLAGGMAFFIDRQVAERQFGPLGADALLVAARPAHRDALAHRLRELSESRGLLFQTYAEVQDRLQGILNTVVASLWVLLALGFLIAVFGVTNTLMMNILEQTREIGLMRVLGMQRRHIRRMVLAQSAYVGVLAIVPGFAAGVTLAYVIRSSSLAILGESPRFGVLLPWLAPYAVGLLLLVLLFGWLPAARGARLNMLEAIRAE